MAASTGIATQVGYIEESTWAVYPGAPTLFLPISPSGDGLNQDVGRIENDDIIAGRFVDDAGAWGLGMIKADGPIKHRIYDHGLDYLLRQIFGGYVKTGAGPYTRTYTPGDLKGRSTTVQLGRPDNSGTVRPFTYMGAKCNKAKFEAKTGDFATIEIDWLAKWETRVRTVTDGATNSNTSITSVTAAFNADDVGKPISGTGISANTTIASVQSATAATLSATATATATGVTFTIGVALASASYPASLVPIRSIDNTVTVAGSALKVNDVTITVDNHLVRREFNGQQTTDEPLQGDLADYMVQFTPEFSGNTEYERFVKGTMFAVVCTFAAGSNSYTFTMNCRYDGDPPKTDARKVTKQPLKAKCVGTSDAAAITVVTVNSDATPA